MSRPGFWRSTFSSLRVPDYRLYFAGQGTTPIGGPAVGWVIALSGARAGLAAGGAACLVAGAGGALLARRAGRAGRDQETGQPQIEGCRAA